MLLAPGAVAGVGGGRFGSSEYNAHHRMGRKLHSPEDELCGISSSHNHMNEMHAENDEDAVKRHHF